ncbi:hypothetical protein QR680_006125 [Steinernema hermaphroditum]|uniref:mitogen-activated protein kinase kinase kinase n=1 Tax=Steinernema hermaphroditum TaxID=289476 RepID=A0AA39HVS3_9BILA|nr:hypothetical protein QR680_006125 [Steinernema hermaphroditum]
MMPSTSAALLMVSSPPSSAEPHVTESADSPPMLLGLPVAAVRSRSRTPAGRPSESEDDVDTSGVKYRKLLFACKEDINSSGDGQLALERGSIIELVSIETEHDDLWRGRCDGREGLFKKDAVIKIGEVPQQISTAAIEIGEEIGSGGFAVVYMARLRRKRGVGKVVAFKKPHYTPDDIGEVKKALEHEAGIFNALRHENIVRLEGICLEEPNIGVLLEYCHGGRLKEVYNKLPDISAQIIIDWASQIAEGMHHIHYGLDTRYFHRDLTTSNILVKQLVCTCNVNNTKRLSDMYDHKNISDDGSCRNCKGTACNRLTLKISDFGMARSERDNRKSDFGTVAYQAPEVIAKGGYSNTSDTYSFGVVIWELFTKCVPFKELEEASIIYNVGKKNLKLPIPDNCPTDIKQLLTDCWETNPDDRPDFEKIRDRLSQLKNEYGAVDDGLDTFQQDMRQDIEQKMSLYIKLPKGKDHDQVMKEKRERTKLFNSMSEYIRDIVTQSTKNNPKKRRCGKDNHKLDATQIGKPGDFRHIYGISPMSQTDTPSQTHRVKSEEQDILFFTMPRKPKCNEEAKRMMLEKMRRMSEDMAGKRKDLSKSTPNLAVIGHSPPQPRSRAPSQLSRCGAVRIRSSKKGEPDTWSTFSTEASSSEAKSLYHDVVELADKDVEAVFSTDIDDSCVTVADEIPDVVVTDVSGACSSDERDSWSRISFPAEDADEDFYQPALRARRDQHRFDSTDDSCHDLMSPGRSTAGRSSSVSSLLSRSTNMSLTPTAEMCSPRKSRPTLACLSRLMLQAGSVLAAPTGCDIKKHATPEGEVPSTSDFNSLSRYHQHRFSGSHFRSPGFEGSPPKSKQPQKTGRASEMFEKTDKTRVYGRKSGLKVPEHPSPTSSISPTLNDHVPVSQQPLAFAQFASPIRNPPSHSPAATIHNSAYVSHEPRPRSTTEDRHQTVLNNAYVTRNRANTEAPPTATTPDTVSSPSYFPAKPQARKGAHNPVYFPMAKPEIPTRTVAVTPDTMPRPKPLQYGRISVGDPDPPTPEHRYTLDSPVPIKPPTNLPAPTSLAPSVPIRPATLDFKTSSMESGIATAESSSILSSSKERSLSPPRERPPPPPPPVVRSTPPPVPPRRQKATPSPPALPPKSSPRLNTASSSQG